MQFFTDVSACIKNEIPGANCIMNKVPKAWYEKEVYCQLIPNEDDNNPHYDILPRIGAFEVSTVTNNTDCLLYSKMMSTMWPLAPALAARVKEYVDCSQTMEPAALREKFQTSGRQVRAARPRATQAQVSPQQKTMNKAKNEPVAQETRTDN